jgi:L-lactate dehydrogenase complex protein LldG
MKIKDASKKEKVLKKIRRALVEKSKEPFTGVDYDSNVFIPFNEVAEIEFAQRFTDNGGKFVFCEDSKDFIENLLFLIAENKWKSFFCSNTDIQALLLQNNITTYTNVDQLVNPSVALTTCENIVARSGSILITNYQLQSPAEIANPDVHLIIAYTSQIVEETRDALKSLKLKYPEQFPKFMCFVAGPSKTADIEGIAVIGAQGPKEVYLFLLDK